MATFTLFDEFLKHLGDGTIDLDTHSFRAMLSNVAPSQSANSIKADITEIAAGNGYVATGVALTGVTWLETAGGSGIWRFTAADPSWTASGGAIATHRYLVIYDDTPTSPADPLVGYADRGSTADIPDGSTRTWDIGASGLFEMSRSP